MSRFAANLITVLIAAAVLVSGTLFSSFVIPAATENGDGRLTSCEVEINTPQEIIQSPPVPAEPQAYFPWSFSNRGKISQEAALEEEVLLLQRSYLGRLRDYVDVLYGLKIDSLIMEKHTATWQVLEDNDEIEGIEPYLFFSDLLFTDASGRQWRITAAGSAEEVFYVSCYSEESVLKEPPNPVQSVKNTQLSPIENDKILSSNYQKIYSAFSRLRGKLYSLEAMYPLVYQEQFYALKEMLLADPAEPVVWSMEQWMDGKNLLTAISTDTFTPVCYVFLRFQQEIGSKYDYLSEFYAAYHGYSAWPYMDDALSQAQTEWNKKRMVPDK